ncbi:MAG: hypothetical protein JWP78_1664 [Mucilaginibacter sp.]|jgi:hypothetical protein|nr:hypothetical protein [Mucilaginibacter sp.]
MVPNLSRPQYEYLRSGLSEERDAIFGRFQAAETRQNPIDLDKDTLCLIRDRVGRELLRIAFGKDVQLTAEADCLAEIIDLLYV